MICRGATEEQINAVRVPQTSKPDRAAVPRGQGCYLRDSRIARYFQTLHLVARSSSATHALINQLCRVLFEGCFGRGCFGARLRFCVTSETSLHPKPH